MLQCVVTWTCNHHQRDFLVDPEAVEMEAVLALTDSRCPECARAGATITLSVPPESNMAESLRHRRPSGWEADLSVD
ncbi:MAG TPA: hypothetical protein VK025_16290 [Steroidobacter sp.]|nr:hypothetical protein [Steroidobacter sp.]